MKKVGKIIEPKYVEREYTINNFIENTSDSQNLFVSKDKLQTWAYYKNTDIYRPGSTQILKITVIDGKIYAYCDDFSFYSREQSGWVKLADCDKEPIIIKSKIDGQDYLVLSAKENENCVLITQTGEIISSSIPSGKAMVNYKGMLFVANQNTLKFSALLNEDDFNLSAYAGGQLKTDSCDGDILELIPEQDALVIVCQKAIYRLVAVGERQDYKLERENLEVYVLEGTVKKYLDGIYFSNGQKIFKYTKGHVVKVKIGIDISKYRFIKGVSIVDNVICFCLREKSVNSQRILVIDPIENKQSIMPAYLPILGDDGYFFEINKLKKIEIDGSEKSSFVWESKVLDFGTNLKKALLRVSVDCSVPVKLSVQSNYSTTILEFDEGCTFQRVNLPGFSYKISLSGKSAYASVSSIRLVYRIKEDM